MKKIAICTCTRKRPEGIVNLLNSIELMQIPSDVDLKMIIVENDQQPATEKVIRKYSNTSKIKIEYFLEVKQGISFARNRSVKEAGEVDFCCFVDDDQSVDKDWLIELLRCQQEFDAEGVWGPNPPVFNIKVQEYVMNFHLPEKYIYGEKVEQAYTNCLMLKKSWLDKIKGPFDLRLNYTGGEDCFLTATIINMGGVIRFTPYAKAYEIVPSARTTLKYISKRTYRTANTKLLIQSLLNKDFSRISVFVRMLMRLGMGILTSLPSLFSKSGKYKGILKIYDALGGIMFIFGRWNKFYK